MAGKKTKMSDMDLNDLVKTIEKSVENVPEVQPKKRVKSTGGRPRLNPHAQDKKLTIRIPEELHRQLRMASADQGKPMTEISVDALIRHLAAYKGK